MDRYDIVACVKKRGTSMAALSRAAGLSRSAIGVALRRPFQRAEAVLIQFLELPAHQVFPDRYDTKGARTVQQGARAHRRRLINTSSQQRRKG